MKMDPSSSVSTSSNSWLHIGLHGHSVGTFQCEAKGIIWQSANNSINNNNNTSNSDDDLVLSRFIPAKALASPAQWSVYGRTAHLRVHNTVANSGDAAQRSFPRELRFDGFPSNAFDSLKALLQSLFRVELVRHPVSVCGASFGNVTIDAPVAGHQNLVFRRCVLEDVNEEGQEFEAKDGEELMSVHLADVSQCVLPGNSRILQFTYTRRHSVIQLRHLYSSCWEMCSKQKYICFMRIFQLSFLLET